MSSYLFYTVLKWLKKDGAHLCIYCSCLQLGREKVMDAFLPDIYGLGFTEWIKLSKVLQEMNMQASPHAWGSRLKTHYAAHLSAGLGNVVTIEGVTCESDEIDYGHYPIVDGKLQVSEAPGFGMKLVSP